MGTGWSGLLDVNDTPLYDYDIVNDIIAYDDEVYEFRIKDRTCECGKTVFTEYFLVGYLEREDDYNHWFKASYKLRKRLEKIGSSIQNNNRDLAIQLYEKQLEENRKHGADKLKKWITEIKEGNFQCAEDKSEGVFFEKCPYCNKDKIKIHMVSGIHICIYCKKIYRTTSGRWGNSWVTSYYDESWRKKICWVETSMWGNEIRYTYDDKRGLQNEYI